MYYVCIEYDPPLVEDLVKLSDITEKIINSVPLMVWITISKLRKLNHKFGLIMYLLI